jgi:arylsulfatase A-like enzyme
MRPLNGTVRAALTAILAAAFLSAAVPAAADAPPAPAAVPAPGPSRPNIVYILCDDLGYGDLRCLNPERCKIATPNADRLAREGMAFTDAHSGSSVCTPTRYGILTGRYCWRTRLQQGVLWGYSAPLIPADRLTVPALLRKHGYHTACIGKWHLGMTMPTLPGAKLGETANVTGEGALDPAGVISDGPTTRGFDRYFGISASLDMPPFAFIEGDRFTQPPTAVKKFLRAGSAAPDFEAVDVLPTLTQKAVEYISARADEKRPFFLYLPLNSPHTPIVPGKDWRGRSGLGDYGDFVMETDWALGRVLDALDRKGIAGDTLVVFTSDNGCSPHAGVEDLERKGHYPSAQFRGYKADIWDGGHRIPFLVRWPAVVKPGTRCGQLTCLTDLMATCAEIVGGKLPDDAGEDSASLLPLLRGEDRPVREAVVHHSVHGRFAVRRGRWKLELCPGSGGWAKPLDAAAAKEGLPPVQLYDMETDAAETKNLRAERPEVVAELRALLERYVADGRSTPGARRANDVAVSIERRETGGAGGKGGPGAAGGVGGTGGTGKGGTGGDADKPRNPGP